MAELEFQDSDGVGEEKKDGPRMIGKYEIHETLGKGAYSWVKRGIDTKTGNIVAMKFLNRADKFSSEVYKQQIRTEIKSLTAIRHEHVIKLLAYNLSAKYPTSDGGRIKTVLLVLEYCLGGELFDLLYYAERLDEIIARTYFRQMMLGLQEIHAQGIAHRDIKPQNILLDSNYCLKITDFGLSKIMERPEDAIMKTTWVGTRGYQAPELLKHKPYTNACDIFSCGVVLFILVAGYPPFEAAHKTDKWFKAITENDFKKFWEKHHKAKLSDDVKELLEGMFCYKAPNRISLEEVFKSKWFNGPVLENKDIKDRVIERINESRIKRSQDKRKKEKLELSHKRSLIDEIRKMPGYKNDYEEMPAKPFPGGIELVGLKTFRTELVPYAAIFYINHLLTGSNMVGNSTFNPVISPHSFTVATRINERKYECSVTAYQDPKRIYTLIRFQTIDIPDPLTWARLYRELLNVIFGHNVLLANVPVVALEVDDVKEVDDIQEEEKEIAKPVRTELITSKSVIVKPLAAKPEARELKKLPDGYK